jgi:hypothetical protein
MRVIPVHSYRQALRALATLELKARKTANFGNLFLPELLAFRPRRLLKLGALAPHDRSIAGYAFQEQTNREQKE